MHTMNATNVAAAEKLVNFLLLRSQRSRLAVMTVQLQRNYCLIVTVFVCTMSFEEKLILEVQKHDILYKKATAGYKNTFAKLRKWQEISEVLSSTGK